jgi:hypothetical protein
MGFFGIAPDAGRGTFRVVECHLNLWTLGLLFWRTEFFLDVGLRLEATDGAPVTGFQVAVPFGTRADSLQDLSDRVRDQRDSGLLFGKPVSLTATTVDYGQGPLQLLQALGATTSREDAASQKDFSLWHVAFEPALQPGSAGYLRVRLRIAHPGRVWTWKRSLLARNGALFDIRVADAREAWNVKDGHAIAGRLVPIHKLRLFLIAPWQWQLRATSPPVHYIRMVEGRAWEKYLDRTTSLFAAPKLVIYQWRNTDDAPVTVDLPFRVFADLSDEYGLARIGNHIRVAVLTAAMLAIVWFGQGAILASSRAIGELAAEYYKQLLGLTVIGLILSLLKNVPLVARTLSGIAKTARAAERGLYRMRRR